MEDQALKSYSFLQYQQIKDLSLEKLVPMLLDYPTTLFTVNMVIKTNNHLLKQYCLRKIISF